MSFAELLPRVLSLSKSDKLRLLQSLNDDLDKIEEVHSEPSFNGDFVEDDSETVEEELVRKAIRAMALRNAVRKMEEEP